VPDKTPTPPSRGGPWPKMTGGRFEELAQDRHRTGGQMSAGPGPCVCGSGEVRGAALSRGNFPGAAHQTRAATPRCRNADSIAGARIPLEKGRARAPGGGQGGGAECNEIFPDSPRDGEKNPGRHSKGNFAGPRPSSVFIRAARRGLKRARPGRLRDRRPRRSDPPNAC